MLHNEARNLLVEAYEKTHDAKGAALAYGVSVPTVYRLAEQKAKTGSVDLRVRERGRKRVLTQEDLGNIAKYVAWSGQPYGFPPSARPAAYIALWFQTKWNWRQSGHMGEHAV